MKKPPSYRLHEASGQARVTISGHTHYLGKFNSKASRDRYDRLISEWLASGRSPTFGVANDQLTVVELARDYGTYCKSYYGKGRNSELWRVLAAADKLKELYKELPAIKFGPSQFKTVRERMISSDWARSTINAQMKRIVRMFKWAAAEGKLPASAYETLRLIPGLKAGRTDAREAPPILPVDNAIVSATCDKLPKVVADMVKVQMLIGCRPSEVCLLTPNHINRSGPVWVAALSEHKTAHHGKPRNLYIGPQAQLILQPYLLRAENERLFQPFESERKRNQIRTEARTTASNEGNRTGYSERQRDGREAALSPGRCYTTQTYGKAITRACLRAFPTPKDASEQEEKLHREKYCWSPNQLRHSRGTLVRKMYGLEAAQVILGHSQANVTQIYAERDTSLAIEIQAKIG